MKSKVLSLTLATFALSAAGCDNDSSRDDGDAPLSDYDALFEGAPTNDELPFEIKADGPAPRQHTDLLEFQSPVKSQGKRGVCSIFSTVGLMEHLYIKAGMDAPDFSEQYLQWSAKFEVNSFPNTSGSNAFYNLQAINRFGIPAEEAWPYEINQWNEFDDPECEKENEDKPTRCYTNGAPPEDALTAEKFFLPRGRWVNSRRASLMDHIRVNETGVVVGLDFFYQSWNHRKSTLPRNLDNWDQGIVLAPNDEDVVASHEQRAGHSIVIVGWDMDKEFPRRDAEGEVVVDSNGDVVMETGFWIFKNSWGQEGFGIDNPHGAGYGWLSMEYVDEHGRARVSDIPDFVAPDPDPGSDSDSDGGDSDGGDGEVFRMDDLVAIPDNDTAGVLSSIEVPSGDSVESVTVNVDIKHTWRGDLVVHLVHGDVRVELHNKTGGGQDDLQLEVTTEEFVGAERKGIWTLEVVDTARLDSGNIESWSITLN